MSPATTTAQVINAFGGPEAFSAAERAIAAPGPGEVQIRVAAAAVNPVDLQTRAGYVVPVGGGSLPDGHWLGRRRDH
jgi:NADPH:quinone reductase